jgi:hypothetical protein
MDRAELLPALSMFTLIAVLLALLIGFWFYWRKPSNRAPKDGGPPTKDGSV